MKKKVKVKDEKESWLLVESNVMLLSRNSLRFLVGTNSLFLLLLIVEPPF